VLSLAIGQLRIRATAHGRLGPALTPRAGSDRGGERDREKETVR
jgi:hypothetical protein